MAILAGEVVAGVAHGRIGRVLADMARGVDDQLPAVANEVVLGAFTQLGDVDRVPIGWDTPQDIAGAETGSTCGHEQGSDKETFQHAVESYGGGETRNPYSRGVTELGLETR